MSEIVRTKLISRHHDDSLVGYFGIEKIWELIVRKYYWLTLRANVKSYVKGYNVCLASKLVKHKLYGYLQSLPVPTHWYKDLFMDFVIKLSVFTNYKVETYDSILVIIIQLTKILHYEPVKVTINAPALAKVISKSMMRHYGLLDSILTDWGSVFPFKFWFSLCYFLGIKRKLSTTFHLQTDG